MRLYKHDSQEALWSVYNDDGTLAAYGHLEVRSTVGTSSTVELVYDWKASVAQNSEQGNLLAQLDDQAVDLS
jgi:hypothetical protein